MKILIGISPNCKETELFLYENFKNSEEKTIVGPFSSSEAASEWMKFMMTRKKGYEQITLPPQPAINGCWYGFTVNSPEILDY